MRATNPWVDMALEFMCEPLRDARIGVESRDASKEAIMRADFVRKVFENPELNLSGFMVSALDTCKLNGFAIFEPEWNVVDSKFVLKRLHERMPSSLSPNPWKENHLGELEFIEQQGPVGSTFKTVLLPVKDMILLSNSRKGNNYQGISAFRSVWYVAAVLMPMLMKLVGITYEREGAGIPVITQIDPTVIVSEKEREAIQDILASLRFHENAHMSLPFGFDFKIISSATSKNEIITGIEKLGLFVLQVAGAQQLTIGTGDTGSRSAGMVAQSQGSVKHKASATMLEYPLNATAAKMCDANFGPGPNPIISITLKRPEIDIGIRAIAIEKLKAAGVLNPTEADENLIREEIGWLPRIKDKGETPSDALPALNVEQLSQAKSIISDVSSGLLSKDAAIEMLVVFLRLPRDAAQNIFKSVVSMSPNPSRLSASAVREWKPWRPLRASEEKLKLGDINEFLSTRREKFSLTMRPLVVEALASAAPGITEAMKDGDPSEVASMPIDFTRINEAVNKFASELKSAGKAFALEELGHAKTLVAEEEEEEEEDAITRAVSKSVSKRIETRLRDEITSEAIDAVRTKSNASSVVARVISNQLDASFSRDAGSMVARIFNVGRDEGARIVGDVEMVERSAVLDGGTCAPCLQKDGTQAEFGSAEHDALMPPEKDCDGRENCRCLSIYLRGDRN